MQNLYDIEAIKKLDPKNALETTNRLLEQLEAAWQQVNDLPITRIENINKVVFCGMGASIYGALVTKSLLAREFVYPNEMVSDYHLPEWTDENTLVVLTSYSGTTEEVLSCAEEALGKSAKMLVLTQGGPLAEFAKTHNVPAYIFDGALNISGTPRLGAGYTILGLMGLLNKAGIITIEEHEITNAITRLKEKFEELKNQAIQDTEVFVGKIPVIFAAEHLAGSAQILRNQFNETSKTFSTYYLVPDLNHHLMEGLAFPEKSPLHFIMLNTLNYSEENARRVELTMDVVNKNKYDVHEFKASGQTIYDDFLEALVYGSFLTLYLAFRYDQNPATNPWVDYFKGQLKK